MSDLVSWLLLVLKTVGVLFTGVLGVLGLTTNYRSEDGSPTVRYRWMISAIVASTFVTVVATAVDEYRKDQDDIFQKKTLSNLIRSTTLLPSASVSFSVRLPKDNGFRAYKARIRSAIPSLLADKRMLGLAVHRTFSPGHPNNGELSIFIIPKTPLWPRKNRDEALPWLLVHYAVILMDFYREPPSNKQMATVGVTGTQIPFPSDLELNAFLSQSKDEHQVTLDYHPQTDALFMNVGPLPIALEYYEAGSSGRIISFADISGTTVIVQYGGISIPRSPFDKMTNWDRIASKYEMESADIARKSSFRNVQISFGKKAFNILGSRTKYPPAYTYTFPSS